MRLPVAAVLLAAVAVAAAVAAAPIAAGAPKKKPAKRQGDAPPAEPAYDPAEVVDVTAARPKLVLLTDGAGHFVAVVPFGSSDERELLFYGDGKIFHLNRVVGYGADGTKSWDYTFWEPRVDAGWKASIGYRNGKYQVQCDTRQTELQPVPADQARAILDGAVFLKPRWKRRAYALARDDGGVYYFVDRARDPMSADFRLYIGPKGNLKLQKMVNVVSDSEGDIFATRDGELRLVLDKRESVWIKKKKRTPLVHVPVEANHVLIYTDLGVYTGERLGTPCDDL